MFRCWSKGLSFCLKGKKIAESITRRALPPRAPLLLYGRNILRLGVPLPKNSSISYEAGLAPSCSPAAQIPYGTHRTAEGAGENITFPPHPPNTARHLPLKGKALLVRPICLHNSSLHNFVYATIKRIPYPSQYAVLCYIFIHFDPLLLFQINLHNSVDIITIFRTAVRSLP